MPIPTLKRKTISHLDRGAFSVFSFIPFNLKYKRILEKNRARTTCSFDF
ncbi:hypothetical protein CTO_1000 [Chlamydia trachomatis A2497]|uniref:Uncharacterized protein n=1 Tax=Chlamydia trachomatis serovar A (strain A2497) TaxID=580047 RepID=G4NN49_CHLT4|nr:hypothetical protein CTO_1000 [Chlamydia trachomatis A2497]